MRLCGTTPCETVWDSLTLCGPMCDYFEGLPEAVWDYLRLV